MSAVCPRPDRNAIVAALALNHGNVVQTAKVLSVSTGWLYLRLAEHGLLDRARELRSAIGNGNGRPCARIPPTEKAIRDAWLAHAGNLHAVSRALDYSRSSLRRLAKGLGLQVGEGRIPNQGSGEGGRGGEEEPTPTAPRPVQGLRR